MVRRNNSYFTHLFGEVNNIFVALQNKCVTEFFSYAQGSDDLAFGR
jgi:hypothetical protein